MHVFPQLRKLESKYSNELAVIGVHSAKFPTEKETENVRMAILRYEVGHPVINDHQFDIWQAYSCRAWPTIMFIDPVGRVVGKHEGEIPYEAFDRLLEEMIKEYDARGLMDRRMPDYRIEGPERTQLSFPGKVLADEISDSLFISDSNHNRIIQTDLEGKTIQVIGGITPGFQDGDFVSASFDHPQGVALEGNKLFVADTENHAIRIVDLSLGYVDTLAGNGEQGLMGYSSAKQGEISLNSPWDITVHRGMVFVAMAGSHQIWCIDTAIGRAFPFAGTGRENIEDGPCSLAALAQPSGITNDGRFLYFVDSETSSVRSVDMNEGGEVTTIVGQGLFEFGDVDGIGEGVRLQHPLGICRYGDFLLITDSYNHKVKLVCPYTKETTTFIGTGKAGCANGGVNEATLFEPGGLSIAKDKLYIADTNNHCVRVVDIATKKAAILEISGM